MNATAHVEDPANRERIRARIGIAMLVVTAVAALVYHSAGFDRPDRLFGDHLYHRGVALRLQGLDGLVAPDYFGGHLSYFSGTWHLVFGLGSRATGLSYDSLVVAASWMWGPAWVGALTLLGIRLWDRDWIAIGAFAALGTFAASLGTAYSSVWIEALLPSGHVFTPLYPRDVALLTTVLVVWSALSPKLWVRIGVTAALLALIVTTHAQAGFLAVPLAAAVILMRPAAHEDRRRLVVEAAAAVGGCMVLSSWWWIPQLSALIEAPPLELGNHPRRGQLILGWGDVLVSLGVVVLLAVPGIVLLLRGKGWRDNRIVVLIWLVPVLLLLPFAAWGGDAGFFTRRRLLLLACVPLIAIATESVRWIAARLPVFLVPAMVAVLIVPSLPALKETRAAYERPTSGTVEVNGLSFPADIWSEVWSQINHLVRENGGITVLAPDEYGAAVFAMSGAHVVSLWLPGTFKVGYDPAASTGIGHRERQDKLRVAFRRGISEICELADEFDVGAVLLDRRANRLGTRDVWPAAEFRVDPAGRTAEDLQVLVGSGLRYQDRNNFDVLHLDPGAAYATEWPSAVVDHVEITTRNLSDAPALVTLVSGGRTLEAVVPPGLQTAELMAPEPFGGEVQITTDTRIELRRVVGFEETEGVGEGPDGPAVFDPDDLCAGG